MLAGALLAGAGVADWWLGPDVPLTLGYLAPISIAAWYLSRPSAFAWTVVTATTWLLLAMSEREPNLSASTHLLNFSLQFTLFLVFGRLVAALRGRLDREKQLAYSDSLTGLANRRAFWQRVDDELRRCRRFDTPFSIAYIDVDDFKSVNDRCGHARGDKVLRRIAAAVQSSIRELDVAARIGGDEFAVLMPGTPEAGAKIAIAKLSALLGRAELNPSFVVTCSIGCLTVLQAPPSVDKLVARADALMYAAKDLGRGQVKHETIDATGDEPAVVRRRAAR